jgi:hemolysin activation/secretion protein
MIARMCRMAAIMVALGSPCAAVAQVIPPSEQPGRERERFIQPPTPRAQPGGPAISVPSTVAPAGAESLTVRVRDIRVEGSTVYSADDLRPLYQDIIGRTVAVQAIYDLAKSITAKYGADGYVLSRAIVPPQELDPKGATIRLEVVEGYVDKVEWPATLARYRDFFTDYAMRVTAERPVNIRTLERYLLLAGDLPGLKISTSLKASEKNKAASTLAVSVTEKPIDAGARLDNRGTEPRGPIQYLTSATLNNFLGQHEALTLTWAGVFPLRELQYIAANFRQVLTSEGLTFFADASYSWGTPGTAPLEILDYRTLGPYFDAGFYYPVIRARERNLTLTGLVFASESRADILGDRFNDDRLRGIRLKADADFADRFQGINQLSVTFSQGIRGLGAGIGPFPSHEGGRVDFDRIEVFAARLQPLLAGFSAYVAGYGQYAGTPLLVPEQCGYGGRYFGRAFDPSQLLGDSCFEAVGELRYDIPLGQLNLSLLQLYGFTDYGKLYTRSPAVGTPANVEAASAGAGLRLGYQSYVSVDLQAAKGIEGPRDDWRFFFIAAAKY